MKYPWMPLFWGDFLANTMHLSAQEAGAYLFLIAHAWEHEGRIPGDWLRLARIAHVRPDQWKKVWKTLEKFFEPASGVPPDRCYIHSRVTNELHNAAELSSKRKGAALQMHSKRNASAEQTHMHLPSQLHANTSKTQTWSAPADPSSKRGPATALPTGAPARSEGARKSPSPEGRFGSNYAVNTPATIPEMDRAAADRQKVRGGMSPDDGLDKRYAPARRPPEHQHSLQPLPDRPMTSGLAKQEDFTPGSLPQCATCNCPRSPSGEQRCWRKILADSTMGKLEMSQ